MPRGKPLNEASMQAAEARIPLLAVQAGREAYARALEQIGRVVMKSAGGLLVERHANGTDVVIKRLPDSTPAPAGAVLRRFSKRSSKPAAPKATAER